MDLKLSGKTAFISGSTAGIGMAIAKRLASEGAEVILNGRNRTHLDEAITKIKDDVPNASVKGMACDFSKKEEVYDLLDKLPAIDILINNVGIFNPSDFNDIDDEEWFHTFEVNVMSGVRLARHIFPRMLKKDWGRIIFISSESAIHIPREMIQYGVSKTAQLAVSRGLAELTKGTNVTVNSVLPGSTYSEGVKEMTDQSIGKNVSRKDKEIAFFSNARPTSLIQRFADPEEIASMVAYVASPLASAVNGAALRVDGGIVRTVI